MPEYFSQLHDAVIDYSGYPISVGAGTFLRYSDVILALVSSMRADTPEDALEADELCRTLVDPTFIPSFEPSWSQHYRELILKAIEQNACDLPVLFIAVATRLVSD